MCCFRIRMNDNYRVGPVTCRFPQRISKGFAARMLESGPVDEIATGRRDANVYDAGVPAGLSDAASGRLISSSENFE